MPMTQRFHITLKSSLSVSTAVQNPINNSPNVIIDVKSYLWYRSIYPWDKHELSLLLRNQMAPDPRDRPSRVKVMQECCTGLLWAGHKLIIWNPKKLRISNLKLTKFFKEMKDFVLTKSWSDVVTRCDQNWRKWAFEIDETVEPLATLNPTFLLPHAK